MSIVEVVSSAPGADRSHRVPGASPASIVLTAEVVLVHVDRLEAKVVLIDVAPFVEMAPFVERPGCPLQLPRDQRQELVGCLAGEGMSTRAIASVTGTDHSTARQDQSTGARNLAPEPNAEVGADEAPVTGGHVRAPHVPMPCTLRHHRHEQGSRAGAWAGLEQDAGQQTAGQQAARAAAHARIFTSASTSTSTSTSQAHVGRGRASGRRGLLEVGRRLEVGCTCLPCPVPSLPGEVVSPAQHRLDAGSRSAARSTSGNAPDHVRDHVAAPWGEAPSPREAGGVGAHS